MTLMRISTASLALGAVVMAQALFGQMTCGSLRGLPLTNASITAATLVAEGPFVEPAAGGGRGARREEGPPQIAPEHCAVKGISRPSGDSEINFELWLPTRNWNGKYQQAGNGGWAGRIPLQAFVSPLSRGYAVAATDDGNQGGPVVKWAIGHPEKLIDFGYRAVHETSIHAKAIIRAFYGRESSLNYFVGCSDGGREALMEAQRYPEDFTGIVAGSPGNDWSHLFAGFVWNEQALYADNSSAFPREKLAVIQKAAMEKCDALDGVKDGLIENPKACRFDPSVLTCKGAETAECLTAPQVEALRRIYAGAKNPRTGAKVSAGYPAGAEGADGAWNWVGRGLEATLHSTLNDFYSAAVYENADWDFRTLNFDTGVAYGDLKSGSVLNSVNPDLRSFRARGGKLIQYHGWGDGLISPLASVDYYESVMAFMRKYPDARSDNSRPVQDFYRLFMVPGMGHCGGGTGPNSFGNRPTAASNKDPDHDVVSALERWVEKGLAPEKLIGTGTEVADSSKRITRPLCVYPQTAHYDGTGNPDDAASFSCAPESN